MAGTPPSGPERLKIQQSEVKIHFNLKIQTEVNREGKEGVLERRGDPGLPAEGTVIANLYLEAVQEALGRKAHDLGRLRP